MESPTRPDRPAFRASRLRPVRTAWLSRRVWTRRLILLAGALLVGLAATAFAKLADWAGDGYRAMAAHLPYVPLLVTPLGFALIQVVTRLWFDGAQGSGIPQVIAARMSTDAAHRRRLLGVRVTLGKVVLVVLGLLVGAAIGREGPTVQVGAAMMFAVAGLAGIGRQRGLVLAGAAAGIAAAFNTPLAGIMFAIEELAKSFERRITAIVATCVVAAGLTSVVIVGDYTYFGTVALRLTRPSDWIAVPLAGLAGGFAGGLFSRLAIGLMKRPLPLVPNTTVGGAAFAGVCGLAVALLALATAGYAAGTSYAETRLALEGQASLPLWYGPAKFAATLLSAVCGIPGGLFSPSLSVGAGLGSAAQWLLPGADPATLATLMMVAYFAGVVQSPLTAFVIVSEMTASAHSSFGLMAAALMGAGTSRLLCREPLYHALAHGWMQPLRRRRPLLLRWGDPVT